MWGGGSRKGADAGLTGGGGGVCQNLEIKGILSKNLEIKQNFVDMMLKLSFVVDMEARDVPHKAQE